MEDVTATIIVMERAALDRWSNGDPSGFLEISAPEVVYFDPFVPLRLNGIEELTRVYESTRGTFRIDRYELIAPHVQVAGDAAVLTFNYVSWTEGKEDRWNCTEVYARKAEGRRIIQTHWSKTATPTTAGLA